MEMLEQEEICLLSPHVEDNYFEATEAEMSLDFKPSNKSLDRAGEVLLSSASLPADRESAQALVNNWRASYSLPLRATYKVLRFAALKIDPDAIVARRLKRMESIILKLSRNEDKHGKLSRMQDIGGCRVVLKNLDDVATMVDAFRRAIEESQFVRSDDYISHPKCDGYRSHHLVLRYKSNNRKYADWNGKKIEIQLRTLLQHAWATTVETVDTFSGQSIKIGGGDLKWRRFFALVSTLFAFREGAAAVPGMPPNDEEFRRELWELWTELQVIDKMNGWTTTLENMTKIATSHHAGDPTFKPSIFVVVLDFEEKVLYATPFSNEEVEQANALYADEEQLIRDGKNAHTVLVAVEKLNGLREAYPNFYADTEHFMVEVLAYLNKKSAP